MFNRRKKNKADEGRASALFASVVAHMPGADEETHRIVTAIAGLLGQVAYADEAYTPKEEARIQHALTEVQGLSAAGVSAVMAALRETIVDVATVQAPWHARALLDLVDREFRVQVLNMLVDVAAADDSVTVDETNVMRHLATSLGLTQIDYNEAQRRHRDKLAVLSS